MKSLALLLFAMTLSQFHLEGQEHELLAGDPEFGSLLGFDVAIDGDFAVAGAPFHGGFGSNHAGAAYIFQLQDGSWTQVKKLLPPWGGNKGDDFGISVDIHGDRVIVGARHAPHDDKEKVGAAYIFARSGTQWYLEAKLYPAQGEAGDVFGTSVGISGTKAIVGAPGDDALGSGAGAAYLYRKNSSWVLMGKVMAQDGDAYDAFATSVAFDEQLAVVGAPSNAGVDGLHSGAAYIFDCSSISSTEIARLVPDDADILDHFGHSVDIDQGQVIVGAPLANDKEGKAYIFVQNGSGFVQQAILEDANGASLDKFGHAVGITEDGAIVGAFRDDDLAGDAGSSFLFARSGDSWSFDMQLFASDGQAGNQFGHGVDIDGSTSISGAPHHTHNKAIEGVAYIYEQGAAVNCEFTMSLSGLIDPQHYYVEDHIEADGIIMNGEVGMHSGNYILLSPGFEVSPGGLLLIQMEGCPE